jgi:hypothetical protein
MKKLLLTGVAVLFLATGTAHAEKIDGLPDEMAGIFCESEETENKALEIYHFQGGCLHNVPPNEVHFWKTGFSWPDSNPAQHCDFERIDAIEIKEGDMGQEPGYIYSVHANCRDSTGKIWTDDFTLEPTEHGMTLRRPAQTGIMIPDWEGYPTYGSGQQGRGPSTPWWNGGQSAPSFSVGNLENPSGPAPGDNSSQAALPPMPVTVPPAPALARWEASFRRCEIERVWVDGDYYPLGFPDAVIVPKDIPAIERGLKTLKKCDKFWQCIEDREAGKVKHCYANDRRWR